MTPADIVTTLQARINKAVAAQTADAALTAAVKGDRDEQAGTGVFIRALRRIVVGMFDQAPDTLAVFGLKAPKPHVLTVAGKAAALAKNKATRAARGTVGPKKKLAIKGTVAAAPAMPAPTAPAPTPVVAATTAPTAPAPTPVVAATPAPATPAPALAVAATPVKPTA